MEKMPSNCVVIPFAPLYSSQFAPPMAFTNTWSVMFQRKPAPTFHVKSLSQAVGWPVAQTHPHHGSHQHALTGGRRLSSVSRLWLVAQPGASEGLNPSNPSVAEHARSMHCETELLS